jgi:endonuclease YncB( thermonuclease family)
VRLECIDAPELKQPYGTRSKQTLSNLVFGRIVRVEDHGRDRYGRLLGRVIYASSGDPCSGTCAPVGPRVI